ncbi:MAG: hypothetical protein A3H35_21795 [Betaproteobacteria bacterium RIFCSPLOWO2_02_FULL_62_17]|nr:MAG: hypothetical protein A3H35_21795 [Betaproteobacteria bacterium RIFCSPLOWO2_02_FULL_62_17]
MTDGSSRGEGLLASMRSLVRSLIAMAQTRLAILASDLEEQGACLAKILVFAALSAVGLFFSTALLIAFVIAAFWENRLTAIGILFAVFLALALWALAILRKHLAERPKLLAATLAELDKDKASLSGVHENDS